MQNDFNLSFLILFISFASLSNLHRRTENLFKEVRKRRLNSVLQIKSTPKPCLRSSLYFVFVSWFWMHFATDKLHDYKNKKIQSVESNGEEA